MNMRIVVVLLGAVVLSFAAEAAMGHFLTPNAGELIVQMSTTPPSSNEWDELWRQWHHVNVISLCVCAPLAGLAAGIFVGLFQKRHAIVVSAISQMPELILLTLSDRAKPWASTVSGLASFAIQHSLPLIAGILGALLCRRFITSRWSSKPNGAPRGQALNSDRDQLA
jgi:hypothetical protein